MANHNVRASIVYRRAVLEGPRARDLARRFAHAPRGSFRSLLPVAGPFQAVGDPIRPAPRDAFAFKNAGGWNMTEDDARVLRERFAVHLDAVKLVAIDAIRTALLGVSVVVPVTGTVGLPGVVVDEVIRRVTDPLTNKLLEQIVADGAGAYGRCGGMAFAGLDYFLDGRDVPDDTAQPASGALRQYIWTRLLDSLDLNAGAFFEWTMQLHVMPVVSRIASGTIGAAAGSVIGGPVGAAFGALVAGGEDILGLGGPRVSAARTRQQLQALAGRLDAGPGWPIGLIYDDSALVWKQHQILALKHRDIGTHRGSLVVWDNNFGRDEVTWTVDATGDELHVTGGHDRDSHIKGIIADDYRPAAPPPAG